MSSPAILVIQRKWQCTKDHRIRKYYVSAW